MNQTINEVETIEIAKAVRNTTINGFKVMLGDVIGLLNNKLMVTGQSFYQVCLQILSQIEVVNFEILTIYYGQAISLSNANQLLTHIKNAYSHLQVEVVNGGQPHYQYIISLE